jgi:hypothetical protein
MYGFLQFTPNGVDGVDGVKINRFSYTNHLTIQSKIMKTYLHIVHPDPFVPRMKFQIFEIRTRRTSEPVYASTDTDAALLGTKLSDERQTVRRLLGWGHNAQDALAMATKKGFVEWQEMDSKPASSTIKSKP